MWKIISYLHLLIFPLLLIGWTMYLANVFLNDRVNYDIPETFSIVKVREQWNINVNLTYNGKETQLITKMNDEKLEDISYFTYNDKNFIISNNSQDFELWLVSKQVENWMVYLYSHNLPYKQTSWTYLFSTLKIGDSISSSSWKKFIVTNIKDVNIDGEKAKVEGIDKESHLVYFTCFPNTDKKRRMFFFKEVVWN